MVVDKDNKGKWTNAEKTGWLKNTHQDANTKGNTFIGSSIHSPFWIAWDKITRKMMKQNERDVLKISKPKQDECATTKTRYKRRRQMDFPKP
jgi:hypothetical protein